MQLSTEEKQTLDSYNKFAQEWSSSHLTFDLWSDEFKTFSQLLPKGKILEIGCGGGRDARMLAKKYEYLGTDISSGLLKEAKKIIRA